MRRSLCISFLIGLQLIGSLWVVSDVCASASELSVDSLGPIVDSIVIVNHEVYDTEDAKYDHLLFRMANKLHVTTRENVIRRELLFDEGEPYPFELAEESARNIRSRLQVFDAWIETDTLPNGHLLVRVVTIDEWTLAVGPNLRKEGDEYQYDLSVTERNLLGRNQEVGARYVFRNTDDNFIDLTYRNNRVFGEEYSFAGGYRNDPVDGEQWLQIGHPFYNLSQSYAYRFSGGLSEHRRDVYSDAHLIGQSFREGDWFEAMMSTRTGSYRRKLEVGGRYFYRYEHTSSETLLSGEPGQVDQAVSAFPSDSAYHLLAMQVAYSDVHFTTMKRIDGFSYTEDFTLGHGLSLAYGRAFRPGFREYAYDEVTARFSQGYRIGRNLLYASYQHRFWFRGSGDIRRATNITGRFYSRCFDFLTLALGLSYRADWRADGSEGLILGGESGLRGYDTYFRTGDRMAVMNLEARFFPDVVLHSVVFSPVLFTDVAQRWRRGEALGGGDMYGVIGAGVRIALEHSARARLIRLDVSYSELNEWQISVSSEQYFSAPKDGFFLTSP